MHEHIKDIAKRVYLLNITMGEVLPCSHHHVNISSHFIVIQGGFKAKKG